MTGVYVVTAVLVLLSVPLIRHHRSAVSVPVTIMVLSVAGWNLARAVRGPEDTEPSLIVAVNVLLCQICAASFYVAARRLVHGRWNPPVWVWLVPVTVGAATFLGMLPRFGITDTDPYYGSPVFVAHLAYTFALLGAGVLTLSTRQHDSSRHVRRAVVAIQGGAVLVLTFQALLPELTSLAVAVVALVMVWSTNYVKAWSRSASRADRLLDSIGVFIFVVDRQGMLQDWNGPAASLLRLTGHTAAHGLDLNDALGMPVPFVDESSVTLRIQGGELRTAVSVHAVDPLSLDSDRVLMFRPVRSSVESSSFPTVSGALKGHDPATQTLGRKAALEQLRTAAVEGKQVLRVDVVPRTARRADEAMFLMARRMEARSEEFGYSNMPWARLDTWTLILVLVDPTYEGVPSRVPIDDVGVELVVSYLRPAAAESPEAFVQRVSAQHYDRDSAQG
ncbi:hypothetical protein AFL01nite_29680 [Aeromicrobium flavum]|uniref:Uncharacterized protein n=1 Tax=Aeromicrobium flavum TaxID=416568 RepID=A0A512HYW4_9ACTN|nr:histidine kinase N-terminal 7TM domain-containing protein [Aeromicrobium flavum]GEO90641.1 hypothetical protein AFL01nite_29680 [Aeromicrobium flavum]